MKGTGNIPSNRQNKSRRKHKPWNKVLISIPYLSGASSLTPLVTTVLYYSKRFLPSPLESVTFSPDFCLLGSHTAINLARISSLYLSTCSSPGPLNTSITHFTLPPFLPSFSPSFHPKLPLPSSSPARPMPFPFVTHVSTPSISQELVSRTSHR